MAKITINGHDFTLNLLDADTVEKFDTLTAKIGRDIQEPTQYNGLSNADGMRLQCRLVDEYLDNLFGAGTAEKVFGDNKSDLGLRLDAFANCVNVSRDVDSEIAGIASKYGFNRVLNREQKRALAKAKK